MAAITEPYRIQLHDTDAAGILFFANQFRIVHDVYERFMGRLGFGFRDRFEKRDFVIPIVHTEADYLRPLRVGDDIEIALSVGRIGRTSFVLNYHLTDLEGQTVGKVSTVHVTIDPEKGTKIELPDDFRRKLAEWVKGGD
jgi:1,4-dihydroxy-2-naphthoyl-CoA hydrolase